MKRIFLLVLSLVLLLGACGQKSPTWQEQYDLGIRYLSEGNYEEAIIAFTAAIEIDPKQAPAFVGRGDAYVGSGEAEEILEAALADYEAALALDEADAAAWLGKADILIRQGKYDEAAEALEEGLEKSGSDQTIADKLAEIREGKITDSSGHVRRKDGYDSSGTLVWYHVYEYNEEGKRSSITSYNAQGVQTGHMEYIRDEEGRMLNPETYNAETGELNGYGELEYNKEGQNVKYSYYTREGILAWYETREYGSNGKLVRSERYNAIENRIDDYTEYDDQGNRTKCTFFTSDGNIGGYHNYEHDSAGHEIKDSQYDANGKLIAYHVYLYDENGEFIGSETYDGDGSLQYSSGIEREGST